MPKMHLRWSEFSYSTFGPFTKNKGRRQKFKETGYSLYICQNKLGKDFLTWFFKDMPRRTVSDKVLTEKAINVTKSPRFEDISVSLPQLFTNYLIKIVLVLTFQMVLWHVQINLLLKVKLYQIYN